MDSCIVVAELRPVIGSCQFFIKMNNCKEVSEVVTTFNKIFIKGSSGEDIAVINIENINIAGNSLSGLRMSNNSIQFRVRIEPNKIYGCFKNEMLFKEENSNTRFGAQSNDYTPDIEANKEIIIFCRQCSSAFNKKSFKFKRILPLPTSFDTGDFFCHNHLSNSDIKLKPEDCLYGLYYVQINAQPSIGTNEKVVFCNHCQAWLGVRERDCIMFWNSSVKFEDGSEENANAGLCDFVSVIRHVIGKDIAVSKIILYARLSNDETHYLLIWVLEKSLSLLTNDNISSSEVVLNEQKVLKVLYLHKTEESDISKKWENDMNTSRIQISKQMMIEGLSHLKTTSQYIPDDFREANQMLVSYIMV